ncbi:MAG: hypothetical protein FWH37_09200 [Candidatus Bathyarchaeota archaeon]|nr:hypothetical protein [Candidatus Termiticorpusculum sp.]
MKASNFASVIDALYTVAKPYRFLVVDTCDGCVCGRWLVRFYFQFKDEQTRKQMTNIIQTILDAEIVATDPSEQQYKV